MTIRTFEFSQIEDLNEQGVSEVFLIPFERSQENAWRKERVWLAQSSRYYVVYGKTLKTGEIVEAMRDGAYNVLDLKDSVERWREVIEHSARAQQLWLELYGVSKTRREELLIGRSKSLEILKRGISRVGGTDASILLLGESGVGKERAAQALHEKSRRKGSFIAVNCAAIPENLIEAELFGAMKGAYTGADSARTGLVREASGGTLFLDEVGEMKLDVQPKLLRFLEARKARPVGGGQEYDADVRIIAATNRDLYQESRKGRFRLDLYYRLAEVTLNIPPLRERKEDIPLLARSFMESACERFGKNYESLDPLLLEKFNQYSWPGNVRELRHAVEQIVLFFDGPIMREGWWRKPASQQEGEDPSAGLNLQNDEPPPLRQEPSVDASPALLNRKQKVELARKLVEQSGGDYGWVAHRMGVHPTTLYRWRMRHGF